VEKRKRGPIVVGVSEPVFPPPLHPPRRQAHKKKITYPCPPHKPHIRKFINYLLAYRLALCYQSIDSQS
jgi:hypothetical protein